MGSRVPILITTMTTEGVTVTRSSRRAVDGDDGPASGVDVDHPTLQGFLDYVTPRAVRWFVGPRSDWLTGHRGRSPNFTIEIEAAMALTGGAL